MSIERISSCIRKLTGAEGELDENANLSVYGLDSLARVELVISLENEFGISFKDSDLSQNNFETISSIYRLIKEEYGIV